LARQATFGDFETDTQFDAILFYECFHHALNATDLLAKMRRLLRPKGRIVLAGEPINDDWWKHWGIRLDPLSVYCIRKFGWLESGWSEEFLFSAFQRAGLNMRIHRHANPEIGSVVVGSRSEMGSIDGRSIVSSWQHDGWLVEGTRLICLGKSSLRIGVPEDAASVSLAFQNYRGRPIHLVVTNSSKVIFDGPLMPGLNRVNVDRSDALSQLTFCSELWIPNDELRNGDSRRIGLHLEGADFR
jgi:hypothetical protein